MAPKII